MAYYEGEIISADVGTQIPVDATVGTEDVVDADIGGSYKGIWSDGSLDRTPKTGTNPVHFRSTDETFYRYTGTTWTSVEPTDTRVFGAGVIWLGKVDGASESSRVNTRLSAAEWLEDNTYDSTQRYFYFDESDQRLYKITSFTASSSTTDETLVIVKGQLDKVFINRAVTFAGETDSIDNIKVRLALDNEKVIGSIMGYAYGKLQIAAGGWDIKFINGTSNALTLGKRIIGKENAAAHPGAPGGYIQEAPDATEAYNKANADLRRKGRGFVVTPGPSQRAGFGIVRVAMIFGD